MTDGSDFCVLIWKKNKFCAMFTPSSTRAPERRKHAYKSVLLVLVNNERTKG